MKPFHFFVLGLASYGSLSWAQGSVASADPATVPGPLAELIQPMPLEIDGQSDVDAFYRVLAVETALNENNYSEAARMALDYLKVYKNDASMAERATRAYLQLQQYPQALEGVRYWLQAEPENPDVQDIYLALLGLTKHHLELKHSLRDRLERVPSAEQDKMMFKNAQVLLQIEDKKEALQLFENSSAGLMDSNSDYHLLLSDFAVGAGLLDRAWDEAYRALDLQSDSVPAVERILNLSEGPNLVQGLNFVHNFIREHPEHRNLRLAFVDKLTKSERYRQALTELRTMQKANPEDFELQFFEAVVLAAAKQYPQARSVLKPYIEIQKQLQSSLNKESTNAHDQELQARFLLIEMYKTEGKYRPAINEYNLIDGEELTVEQIADKARIYGKLGEIPRALRVLELAHTNNDFEKALLFTAGGDVLKTAGRTDQAINYLSQALQQLPDNVTLMYDLAMYYETRGELKKTEELLRKVIDISPDMSEAYNALGYVFADNYYNLTEAQTLLDRALIMEPDNPYILDSMGWLQYRLKNYVLAQEYLEHAYEIEEQAEIAAHLADVYVALGNTKRAKTILQRALKNDTEANSVLRKTIERLKLGIK